MVRGKCLRTTASVTLLALVGLFCLAVNASAATATANAEATVIAALTITATRDLDFGTVAFADGAGTIVVGTNDARSATGSGVAVSGSPAAAEFAITGEGTNTYAITLPGSITITDGTNDMTVDTFVSNPDTTGTLTAGADTFGRQSGLGHIYRHVRRYHRLQLALGSETV